MEGRKRVLSSSSPPPMMVLALKPPLHSSWLGDVCHINSSILKEKVDILTAHSMYPYTSKPMGVTLLMLGRFTYGIMIQCKDESHTVEDYVAGTSKVRCLSCLQSDFKIF